MTRRCGSLMPALVMFAVVGASGNSEAQELRRDASSDGAWIGAGTGAAAGAVLSLATEDICSVVACAYVGSVAGGLIGYLVDRKIEHRRPIAPGSHVWPGTAPFCDLELS